MRVYKILQMTLLKRYFQSFMQVSIEGGFTNPQGYKKQTSHLFCTDVFMSKKLTDKQEMFCREYLLDLNATQAAIRAGYSEKTARNIAGNLLTKINIQMRISELKAQRCEEVKIDANWVLINAKRVFDRCMQDEPILTRDGDPVIVSTENGDLAAAYKFDSNGANKALDTIGKHVEVNAFKTNIDHSSSDGTMSPTAEGRDKRKARIQELLNAKSRGT